ncbi:Gfo/Idh/MocA family oxidoreductase [Vibrio tapetis subsp. quintayensis]|uniref:Gfo/Idh/MocA family protein n=1 Tax=Vibrio tapetis TaxID=52443 RepID=UPI0025B5FF11|nr:Gfo/Idh/MocA family oxidoreductase [Vibrio tapetis]MDN3683021.1 Gfo/Idh/MocA family oxidoreductase [Vibrio tapetis subsp. quintayensis]
MRLDKENTPTRWGIIAPGRIAHRFAQAFESITDGTLCAVASRNPQRTNEFANQYNIPKRYHSYQDLLTDDSIDAVYIANPHRYHCDIASKAIQAGKSVLCEKPLTVNRAQSEYLFELASKHQVFIMEALWSRFLPIWQQVKRWVDDGEIGELRGIQSTFGFKAERNVEDRLFNLELAGGALLDTGVYNIALTDFVIGCSPTKIESDVLVGDTGVDEECSVTLHYENALGASIQSSFTCGFLRNLDNTFEIVGSEGNIVVAHNFWEAEQATLQKASDSQQNVHIPYRTNGFEYQIDEVHQCLRNNRLSSQNVSPKVTLRNMAVMDEILNQAGVEYPFL